MKTDPGANRHDPGRAASTAEKGERMKNPPALRPDRHDQAARAAARPAPRIFAACLTLLVLCLLAARQAPCATETTFVYDADGRLTAANMAATDAVLGDFRYGLDAAGNITSATVTVGPYGLVSLDVDPAGAGTVTLAGADACDGPCQKRLGIGRQAVTTASPTPGWRFLGWTGDHVGADNPHAFTLAGGVGLTAHFGAQGGATDADPLADAAEAGPNGAAFGYDGDQSGLADYLEDRTVSLATATGKYLTIAVTGTRPFLSATTSRPTLSGRVCPYGAVATHVSEPSSTGACRDFTWYLPKDPRITKFYALDDGQWIDFAYNGVNGAQFYQDADRTRVVVKVCDGGRGDSLKSQPTLIGLTGAPGYAGGGVTPLLELLLRR